MSLLYFSILMPKALVFCLRLAVIGQFSGLYSTVHDPLKVVSNNSSFSAGWEKVAH